MRAKSLTWLLWFGKRDFKNAHAIGLPAHLIATPLSIFGGVQFRPGLTFENLIGQMGLAVLAQILMSTLFFAAWLAFYSRNPEQKRTNLLLVSIGLVAGSAKGVAIEGLSIIFLGEPFNSEAAVERACTAGVTMAIAAPVFAHLTTRISNFRAKRSRALEQWLEIEGRRLALNEAITKDPTELDDAIKQRLVKDLRPLSALLEKTEFRLDEGQISLALENSLVAASEQMRNLSHDLAKTAQVEVAAISKRRLIFDALAFKAGNHQFLLTLISLTNFLSPLFKGGLVSAILQLLFGALVCLTVLSLADAIGKRIRSSKLLTLAVCSAYASLHAQFQLNVYQNELSLELGHSYQSLWLLNFLVMALAVWFEGIRRETIAAERAQLEFLDDSIERSAAESDRLEDAFEKQVSKFSAYLHGYLQSQFMASAINIAEGRRRGDSAAVWAAILHLKKLTAEPLAHMSRNHEIKLGDSIERLQNLWAGMLDIELAMNMADEELSLAEQVFCYQAIEEAAANAYRHAKASHLMVSISTVDQRFILLEIRNNGHRPSKPTPGLGFALFEKIAPQNWTLSPGAENGSVLFLRISRLKRQ